MQRRERGGGRKSSGTHDDIVPEYVALPYPPEPIIAHYCGALDVVARMCRELEWVELAHVLPDLLDEQGPRDAQERRYAGVAHEVRHVRVPIIDASRPSTANAKEERETHVCATSSANASVL